MVLDIDWLYAGLYEKKKVVKVFAYVFGEDFANDRSYARALMHCSGDCKIDLRTASFVYAIAVVNFIYNDIRETANLGGLHVVPKGSIWEIRISSTFERWKRRWLGSLGIASTYTEMRWDWFLPPILLLAITSLLL